MARIVFVNHDLMKEEQLTPSLITDCIPAFAAYRNNGLLEITFGDNVIYNEIKEKLMLGPLNIKVRIALPKILHHMYDDCLRYRRELLRAPEEKRSIFVDFKTSPPYVSLVEKTKHTEENRRERKVPGIKKSNRGQVG
jgi:hypothetical protein